MQLFVVKTMQTALHRLLNLCFLCKLKGINVISASFVSLTCDSACCFGLSTEGGAFHHKNCFTLAVAKPEIPRLKSDSLRSAEQATYQPYLWIC